LLAAHTLTSAQESAALNTYAPAEHPGDGFLLSSGRPTPHLGVAAQLHVDYANDPLVYEDVAGRIDSELVTLVSDQVTSHLAVSLGVGDIAMLYAGWQLHLVMLGDRLGDQPTATGFGSGDLRFGGRIGLFRSPTAAAALQLTITAPTAEGGSGRRPGVAGDGSLTVEPEITADVAAGPFTLLINAGARWRDDTFFAGARFTDVLTFGVGAALPVMTDLLQAHLELQGASPLDDIGDRATSPLQALLGVKLTPLPGWTFGAAGGAGLLRGYGSPDARGLLTIGHGAQLIRSDEPEEPDRDDEDYQSDLDRELPDETPVVFVPDATGSARGEAKPTELQLDDGDLDSVRDLEDRCPLLPGRVEESGCPLFIRFDPQTGAIELLKPIRFTGNTAVLEERSGQVLDEVAAVMHARPKIRMRIEGHLRRGGRRSTADRRSADRAVAVTTALAERGVDVSRLEAFGCSSNRPLVPDRSEQSYKNERVDLYVFDPLPPAGFPSTVGCEQAKMPEPPPEPPKPAPVSATPPPPAAPKAEPPPAPLVAPKLTPAPAPLVAPKLTPAPLAAPKLTPAPAPPAPKPAPAAPVAATPRPAAAAPSVTPTARPSLPVVAATATTAQVAAAIASDSDGDRDRDGKRNGKDECPLAPGDGAGCPEGHRVDLEGGRIELLKPIRFEDGSATLDTRGKKLLDEIAATLRANADMKVAIATHVAADAGAEPSLALTRKRATTVRRELTQRGVSPARIHAYGCGENRPVAPNNVPWGRKKNERVDVLLLDPAPASSVHSLEGCSAAE
jgi:outer membrane protein OmpA-like peptidoglycan-associated protein